MNFPTVSPPPPNPRPKANLAACKAIFAFLILPLLALSIQRLPAATGFFGDGTGAAIFYVTDGSTAGEGTYKNVGSLNNFDYGDFIVLNGGSTTLMLRGGEGKTYKNSGGDVYGVTEYYRIYVDGATPGSFTSFSLPFSADLGGGDQRWKKTDQNVNLLSGLTQSGRYVVEFYWEQTGNEGTNSMNNGGSNYKTYFDLNYEINSSSTVTQNTTGGAATLSGNGTFVKKGTGTVQINANNSAYTGNAFVDQGTLEFQAGSFLTSGSITLGPELSANTGTLTISDSDGGTNVANTIVIRANGTGSTIGASNTSGTNSYSGSIYLDGNATTSISSGGTLSLNGTELDLKNQNLTVTGSGNTSISAVVKNTTGSGKIVKQGNGTLTLTGANTLSGNTEIDAGTLAINRDLALNVSGSGGLTISGNASGTGAISVGGTGILTFTHNNSYTGTTFIGSGATLQLGSNSTSGWVGSTSGITNNGTFSYSSTSNQTLSGTISGTGALTKAGSGTLTLSGANTYSGGTTVNGTAATHGLTLASNTAAGTGTITVNGYNNTQGTTLYLNDGVTISNDLVLAAGSGRSSLYLNSGNATYSGNITTSGTTGSYAFFYNNGSGNLTVNGNVASNARETWFRSGNFIVNGNISGNTNLRTENATSVTLSGNNTYTGNTTINSSKILTITGAGLLGGGNYSSTITNNGTPC